MLLGAGNLVLMMHMPIKTQLIRILRKIKEYEANFSYIMYAQPYEWHLIRRAIFDRIALH